MPRASSLLSTFNAGEWSPDLYGRIDLDKYRNACRTIENFVLLAQGPATRRPGTQFIAPTKSDGVVRLIPFEFSTEQAYVIEAVKVTAAPLAAAGVKLTVPTFSSR